MYRTVVTICTASGHYMYRTVVTIYTASLTFNNSTFCPHTVFMCFVWIWEQTAIISLYSINWLVFITEMECVYRAVRTGSLYKTHYVSSLKVLSNKECSICKSDLNMSVRLYTYQACDTNGNILHSKINTPINTVRSRLNVEHAHMQGIAKSSICSLEWQVKWRSLQPVLPPIHQITAVAKVTIPLPTLNHVMSVWWMTVHVYCSLTGSNSGCQDLRATMYIQQTDASLFTSNHDNGGTKSLWNTEF
jgi:hypothetical protein